MALLVGTKGSAQLYRGTDRSHRYRGARPAQWMGQTVFADDFNREDSLLESSPGWTRLGGNTGAVSIVNGMIGFSPQGGETSYAAPDVGAGDCFAEGVNQVAGSANSFPVCVKLVDANNFLGVRPRTNTYQLYSRVGGTFTLHGWSQSGQSARAGDLYGIEVVGVEFFMVLNGARISGPYTVPAALRTATKAGIVARGDSLRPVLDNWRSGSR